MHMNALTEIFRLSNLVQYLYTRYQLHTSYHRFHNINFRYIIHVCKFNMSVAKHTAHWYFLDDVNFDSI